MYMVNIAKDTMDPKVECFHQSCCFKVTRLTSQILTLILIKLQFHNLLNISFQSFTKLQLTQQTQPNLAKIQHQDVDQTSSTESLPNFSRHWCLGKASMKKKRFLSGIARMRGGGSTRARIFWPFFQEVHFWSIKRVYFFKNANVLNF